MFGPGHMLDDFIFFDQIYVLYSGRFPNNPLSSHVLRLSVNDAVKLEFLIRKTNDEYDKPVYTLTSDGVALARAEMDL